MPEVSGTGAASLAALDSALEANEITASAEVKVLAELLKTQSDFLAEVLQSLGVGTQLDVTA